MKRFSLPHAVRRVRIPTQAMRDNRCPAHAGAVGSLRRQRASARTASCMKGRASTAPKNSSATHLMFHFSRACDGHYHGHSAILRRRRRRLELAAIKHGVVALLTLLEAHRGAEHVSSTLRLLEFMHPPIRHLTRAAGVLDAGPIGPVHDRNALHLVPILLGIRP